jgi:hypothetical protein
MAGPLFEFEPVPGVDPELASGDQVAEIRRNIAALFKNMGAIPVTCRGCPETIYFLKHANGASTPYTTDGMNHFKNCPKAKQFTRKR